MSTSTIVRAPLASRMETLMQMLLDLEAMAMVEWVQDGATVTRHLPRHHVITVRRDGPTVAISWGACTLVVMYRWRTIIHLNFTVELSGEFYEYLFSPTTGGEFCSKRTPRPRGGLELQVIRGVPDKVVYALPGVLRDRFRIAQSTHLMPWS